MKWLAVLSMMCHFPGWLAAGEKAEKPILVLNAGGHTGRIWDVLFTPGSGELISVSYDKTIRIWNVEDGTSFRTLRPPIGPGNQGRLICANLSPDGTLLAVAGTGLAKAKNSIYLISLISGEMRQVLLGHTAPLNSVAFSPDGKLLGSSANDSTARIWELATGKCLQVLEGHKQENVNAITFSPDSKWVGTACADKTARIWSAKTGEEKVTLQHQGGVLWLAFAPDNSTVATVAGNSISLWSREGKFLKESDRKALLVYCAFTRDSKQVLFVGNSNGLYSPASGEIHEFTSKEMCGGALSSDGNRIATVNTAGKIFLWNAKDGRFIRSMVGNSEPQRRAGWSPDGNTVAFNADAEDSRDRLNRTFRLDTLELSDGAPGDSKRGRRIQDALRLERVEKTTVVFKNEEEVVHRLAIPSLGTGDGTVGCFSFLDAKRAVLGNNNGQVVLFNLQTGKLQREFQGHIGEVLDLAPSPDGRYILTASNDHTLRIWQPDQNEPLLSLFFAREDWIAWTPQGYYAASPGGEHLMGWHVNNGLDKMASYYPAAQFRKSLYRPDVIKLLLRTGSVERALEVADKASGKKTQITEVAEVLPPFVLITSPDKAKVEVAESTVEIRFIAKPVGKHPITAVRLMVNGRPYPGAEGLKKYDEPRTGEVRDAWTVRLSPGVNKIAVQAESPVSKALSEPVEVILSKARGVEREPDEKEKKLEMPSLYVLAIGVSEYPQEALKLKYAAKDAKVLAKTFQATSHALYQNVEVKLLTDKDATRRNILQGLTWLRKQMTQRDVAIVSFAGHGSQDADGKLYLLPVDVDKDDLLSTAVPGEQIKSVLGGIPGRVIVLLDACHSGAVDGEKRRSGGALTDDLVRDLVTDDYGVIVMCSSMGREFSLESASVEHGFFTLALVEGLSGKADYDKSGVVYLNGLDLYVTTRVKELSKGKQHPVTTRPTSIRSFPLSRPEKQSSSRSPGTTVPHALASKKQESWLPPYFWVVYPSVAENRTQGGPNPYGPRYRVAAKRSN